MRKITGYIMACAVSAGLLAVPAFAAGGVVNGVVRGAETALSDAGDLLTGDGTTTAGTTAPDVTDLESEKTTAATSATTAATTAKPNGNNNPATGATLGFAALGLSAAAVGLASRKKK